MTKRNEKLVFAMNGGMFMEDYSPLGLYIENYKRKRKLNTFNAKGNFYLKPNGVFAIFRDKNKTGSNNTTAIVCTSQQYANLSKHKKSTISYATQSGPMLLINGKIHHRFMETSDSRKYRNGVGIDSNSSHIIYFAISDEPVNFYHFAKLFKYKLRCKNALFLDGSVSSIFASSINRNDFRRFIGPIIGISE